MTLRSSLISCLFLLTLVGGGVAHAQQTQDYVVLTPLPGTTYDCTDSTGHPAQCAGLSDDNHNYLKGLFNLSIGVGAIAAFIMITFYGFVYMTSEIAGKKKNALDNVQNAFWGLLLVIFAYAILYTINPALVAGNLTLTTPSIQANSTGGGSTLIGGNFVNSCADKNSASCTSENSNRSQLASVPGISVDPPCNGNQASGCTNIAGVPQNVIDDTKALENVCKTVNSSCTISISGGTEHQPANTLDMRPNAGLNQFITGSAVVSGPIAPITKTINNQQVTFTYEQSGQVSTLAGGGTVTATGNHWHVSFPKQ